MRYFVLENVVKEIYFWFVFDFSMYIYISVYVCVYIYNLDFFSGIF